jgi:hypothetical protein
MFHNILSGKNYQDKENKHTLLAFKKENKSKNIYTTNVWGGGETETKEKKYSGRISIRHIRDKHEKHNPTELVRHFYSLNYVLMYCTVFPSHWWLSKIFKIRASLSITNSIFIMWSICIFIHYNILSLSFLLSTTVSNIPHFFTYSFKHPMRAFNPEFL